MEQSPPSAQPDDHPLAEARRLLLEDEHARRLACAHEIEAVLTKYGMRLDVTQPQISITSA